MSDRLKLRALDEEDLRVLSTFLQDAAVPVGEMRYLREEKRFAVAASRFRWEVCDPAREEGQIYERIACGLVFDEVEGVAARRLDLNDRAQVLALLAVEGRGGKVNLIFAGGAEVRLEVGRIVCHLQDLGEPWPTQWRPRHPDAEGG